MTTSWYYDAHKKGTFSHQKQLCVAVRWTECNLEGQELKSPNHLSAIQGNPLTIRLLALDEALKHFNNAKKIAKNIKELARGQFDKKEFVMMSGTWHAEGSSLNTKGAPIEIIEIAGEHFELKYIDIQLALYGFFTSFGSILDRLTYEINMLYNLEIPQNIRYWSKLTNESNLAKLIKKDVELARLLEKYLEIFKMVTRYRNRMVHDGIIRVEVDISVFKFSVMLAENPNDNNSSMNVDAIEFCTKSKADILKLLDESYSIMFQHFQTHGKPPW